jgi:hypothetical protein
VFSINKRKDHTEEQRKNNTGNQSSFQKTKIVNHIMIFGRSDGNIIFIIMLESLPDIVEFFIIIIASPFFTIFLKNNPEYELPEKFFKV